MTFMLAWLAIPLLLAPLVPRTRFGVALAQLVLSGAALAAWYQGAATLSPGALHTIAAQSPGDAWFVGISVGVIIAGAGLVPAFTSPWLLVLALPLIGGALLTATPTAIVPIVVGAAVALLPVALGFIGPPPQRRDERGDESSPDRATPLLGALAVAATFIAPTPVTLALLVTLVWWRLSRARTVARAIAGVAFTVLLAAFGWAACTIAVSPWSALPRLARDAPVSPAAGTLLAAVALPALALALWPWKMPPARRAVLWVAVVIVFHFIVGMAGADGVRHWQSVATTAAVIAAVVAAWGGWEMTAVAALTFLTASRSGDLALAAALLAAVSAPMRYFVATRVWESGTAFVIVLVVVAVFHDQVLAAVVLALGLAAAGRRAVRCVAPVPLPDHY